MSKEREIDHDNDRYRELVVEEGTGIVLHEVEESLSEHFGHGSAKFEAVEDGGLPTADDPEDAVES